jgi:hypothetical protein
MGGNAWIAKATEALGLEATLKPIGRPKLEKNGPRYL